MNATLVACKFLDSKDRLILAGNGSNGGVLQVLYEEYLNHVDGKKGFVEKCQMQFDGLEICSLELCGISSSSKLFVIIAGQHLSKPKGCVKVFECQPTANSVKLLLATEIQDPHPITSLASDSENELLIYSNEFGEIIQLNLGTLKEISRCQVDPAGINKIQFSASKNLVCLGNSIQSSANIIDIRVSAPSSSSSRKYSPVKVQNTLSIRNFSTSLKTRIASSSAQMSGFMCLDTHPTQAQVMLGCYTGNVLLWDSRSTRCMEFQPHHCRVTDIKFHPLQHDRIVTSSIDGSVMTFDYFQNAQHPSPSSAHNIASFAWNDDADGDALEENDLEYDTLISHTASINALDVEAKSCSLLAVSNMGKFWNIPL